MNAHYAIPLSVALLCARVAAQDAPVVVSLSPAHLATDVDPDQVTALVITFDRDMDPKVYSLCGGGPSFPKLNGTSWRDARTFVAEVQLAPDHVYSMDLACPGSGGFRSTQGGTLPWTPWRIATRGEALPEGSAPAAAAALFAALREHYSYLDRIGIDWSSVEHDWHERLANAPNGAALALHAMQMLTAAQDPHISVHWRDAVLPTYLRQAAPNFDMRGLRAALPNLTQPSRISIASRTDDGIGYLLVGSFAREQRDEFERTLQALRGMRDLKALVLDVRTNGGGDELLARRLAGFFVRDEAVYAGHRLRDPAAPGGFGEVQKRSIRGNPEPDVFRGPVAVLMGPMNLSSAEAFLLMMKQAPQAVLIGEQSYGSSGNPQPARLLPGLDVMLPSWQALRPDGVCFEGMGIAPHIFVQSKPEQFVDGDPVLEAALSRLRNGRAKD